MRRVYRVSDESGHVERYRTTSVQRAAERYVYSGDWDRSEPGTQVHEVTVVDPDGSTYHPIVVLDVPPPSCRDTEDGEHDWRELDAYGGVNGGVRVTEACRACALRRVTETRGQSRQSGRTVPGGVVTYRDVHGGDL